MSKAFDDQALASAEQQRQLQDLGDELQAMTEQREAAEHALATSNAGKAAATARAERAEATASSQEQPAADMKEQLALANTALAHAHEDMGKAAKRCSSRIATRRTARRRHERRRHRAEESKLLRSLKSGKNQGF